MTKPEKALPDSTYTTQANRLRVQAVIKRLGIVEQMKALPAELPYEDCVPEWLGDLQKADPAIDTTNALEALNEAAAAVGCNLRQSLKLIIEKSPDIALNSDEIRSRLMQACPERGFLISLLVRAIDSGVVADLLRLDDPRKYELISSRCIAQLKDNSLDVDLSDWILSTWSVALGVPVSSDQIAPYKQKFSMFNAAFAVLLGVVLLRQLFWYLWAIDEQNRWREGFTNATWCGFWAAVIGALFAIFFFRIAIPITPMKHVFDSITDRHSVILAVWGAALCSGATGVTLVVVESILPPTWNSLVATCFGIILGVAVILLFKQRAVKYLLIALLVVLGAYYLDVIAFYDEDPEALLHFTCFMPGGDALFLLLSCFTGSIIPGLIVFQSYGRWKSEPQNRFQSLSSVKKNWNPVIAVDRFGEKCVFTDGESCYIQTQAAELAPIWKHSWRITAISFAPSGAFFASASCDATACVWCWEDNANIAVLYGHATSVTAIGWSSCGSLLATGTASGTILVWDATKWKSISHLSLGPGIVTSIAFDIHDRNTCFVCFDNGRVCRIDVVTNSMSCEALFEVGNSVLMTLVPSFDLLVIAGTHGISSVTSENLTLVVQASFHTSNDGPDEISAVIALEYDAESDEVLICTSEGTHCWDLKSEFTRELSCDSRIATLAVAAAENKLFGIQSHSIQESPTPYLVHRNGDMLSRYNKSPCEPAGEPKKGNVFTELIERHLESAQYSVYERNRNGFIVRAVLVLFSTVGAYGLFGMAGWGVGGSFQMLSAAIFYESSDPTDFDNFSIVMTRAWREGMSSGWHICGITGMFFVLLASIISMISRWHAEIVRIYGELGILGGIRWLILPATVLCYVVSTSWTNWVLHFLLNELFWILFISLFGWSIGIVIATCIVIRVHVLNNLGHQSFSTDLNKFSGMSFGASHMIATVIIGLPIVLFSFGLTLLEYPTSMAISALMQISPEGTTSGRGTLPNTFEGIPGNPVPIDLLWNDFETRPTWAEEEYVGRNFMIEGFMTSRYPVFRISDSTTGKDMVHCEFGYQDFELIKENRFLNDFIEAGGQYVQIKDGQRVRVSGICVGLDERGLVLFEKCRINRSIFQQK
ncbi:WD40 repeat domain-containing protein [Gimesia aquarii]|nr:WD40 repeat domain-containing protein [Gimesia aquarii]